jgi:hypothetical protein
MSFRKALPGRYRVRPSRREGNDNTLPPGGSASKGRGGKTRNIRNKIRLIRSIRGFFQIPALPVY